MDVRIDTGNIKILQDFFNDLSTMDQRKIFISSFKKAARPLIAAAKSNIHDGTTRKTGGGYIHYGGSLRRSIGAVATSTGAVSILVGARLTGPPSRKGWHGIFTEEGTKERFRRGQSRRRGAKQRGATAGGATGKVTAQHWMQRAFNSTSEKMYDSMEGEWYKAIDRFIIKTNKKLK